MAPPPPVAISSLFCANASNAISFVTSNVSCATLSASTSISSAGNVIATGGYVPLSALSNSISLASLPGQLLPSAFSNSSIPVSAISGTVGSSTSNYVTLSASNIVSAGNVIASGGYVPLSALSNSISLASLPGQLPSSAFAAGSVPVSALSNVSIASTAQPILCYNFSNLALTTSTNTTALFGNVYSSQGQTGFTYSNNGTFVNTSGSALVANFNYSVNFSSNSSVGIRECFLTDGALSYGISATPGTTIDSPWVSGAASVQVPSGGYVKLSMFQDSGSALTVAGHVQIVTLNSPTVMVNAAVQSPMHLSLYGVPSTYSSGSSVANTTWTAAGYYYFLFPSSSLTSVNWTPAYVNTTRLVIPVTGLYSLKLTFIANGTYTSEVFISKNMNNNNDINSGDDRLLAVQTASSNEVTISATAYLVSSDFVSFGFYSGGATIASFQGRCTATVTLIQNTSSIAANVAGNLKLGTVTNPYGYPVDPAGTSGNISAGNVGMFRNRIINGNMAINQRGVTSLSLPLNAYAGTYTLDRFLIVTSGTGVCAFSNVNLVNTDVPYQYGLRASFKNTITTAYATTSTNFQMQGQHIEGNNIQDLNWGQTFGTPVTLSFWSRTSAGVTSLPITVQNSAQTYSYNANITITSGGTWQYNTITIPAPPSASVGTWDITGSLTSNGMRVYIGGIQYAGAGLATSTGWVVANSIGTTASSPWITTVGNYVEFTGLQLEKGTIATPFEFRPYSIELLLCQRYYEKSYLTNVAPGASTATYQNAQRFSVTLSSTNSTTVYFNFQYKVSKRNYNNLINLYSETGVANQLTLISQASYSTTISQSSFTFVEQNTDTGYAVSINNMTSSTWGGGLGIFHWTCQSEL